jgi:zinc finger SWIM domain-containing protein 3
LTPFFSSENLNESSIPIVEGVDKWVNSIHESILPNSQESFVDYTPHLNMEFDSEVAAYEFLNDYSRRIGFGIRREYGNKSKIDGILTSRRFSCFKEGRRGNDKRDHLTKESRAETRTGCKARMVISLDRKIEKYKVVDFVDEHNHPLQPPGYVHMIRSH